MYERRDVRHSTVVERGVAPAEWKLFERVRIVVCVCVNSFGMELLIQFY